MSVQLETSPRPQLSIGSAVSLRGGVQMPLLGLGTWQLAEGGVAKGSVAAALAAGYRMIDRAAGYQNEGEIGDALAELLGSEGGPSRGSIFITTKLPWGNAGPNAHSADGVIAALEGQLAKLRLEYVDLYLVHTPKGGHIVDTWRGMLAAKARGLVRAVGVSNFSVAHMEAMKAAGLEAPEVVQNELHVWHQQRRLLAYCEAEGVAVTGYCPLGRGAERDVPPLAPIAAAHGKTTAQV